MPKIYKKCWKQPTSISTSFQVCTALKSLSKYTTKTCSHQPKTIDLLFQVLLLRQLVVFIAWKIKKHIFIGFTKLLVGVGYGGSGYLNSIEIIDLAFPSTSCQDYRKCWGPFGLWSHWHQQVNPCRINKLILHTQYHSIYKK